MAAAQAAVRDVRLIDLRELRGDDLRPLLERQGEGWQRELRWDFASARRLIQRFLDARRLFGYAYAVDGRLEGYCYFIYEDGKALIGDLYCCSPTLDQSHERALFERTLEAAALYPGVRRIEGQLLERGVDPEALELFGKSLTIFPRLYMVREGLRGDDFEPEPAAARSARLRRWREADLEGTAELIADAYHGHVDARINDQYQSVGGAYRFLLNTTQHTGCGSFLGRASIIADRRFYGSPLGVCLTTRVADDAGHVAQLCVDPRFRRRGLGLTLLRGSLQALRDAGCEAVSLTVTESNTAAIRLYSALGFVIWRRFPAFVWEA